MIEKARKILVVVVAFALIAIGFIFFASGFEKVSENPIDARHTDAHTEIVTDYKYEYDIFSEEGFKKMPNIHSQQFPEKWEICYSTEYKNGATRTEWREVTREEYEDYYKEMEK